MSNGVELIIASDKLKHQAAAAPSSVSASASTSAATQTRSHLPQKPVTLAPSTLKNHMILALPTSSKQENFSISLGDNQFITKTCLTTYTYHTTYLTRGSLTVESREQVVANRQTEERNFLRASSPLPFGVTLSNTPELVVGIFPTTYHYYNTLRNNGLVLSSTYTVMNTVTGPEDYISYLQPSEEATPVLDTNTYYSRLAVTRTAPNGIVTDSENILTQLVITESRPGRGNPRNPIRATSSDELDVHIFATKTYLTTVTYLATTSIYPASTDLQGVSSFETKVIVNTITDTVPSTLLRPELVSMFRTEFMQKKGKNNRKVLVTLATLLGGQTLEVTAVNFKKAGKPTATNQISSTLIKPTATKTKQKMEQSKTQTKLDELQVDLSVAESQNEQVNVRPLKEATPNPTSVEQLIGSLNLQRLRPVFDVMADLIQKNIANRQATTSLHLRQTPTTTSTTTTTTTSSPLEEKPVYIPLEVNVQQKAAQHRYKSHPNKADIDINRSRLTAHSLHINPPEPEMSIDFNDDDNWLLHNNNRSHISRPLSIYPTYPGALLNNGIPIRPGEIINANADVIIGRPNGILHSPHSQFFSNSSPRPKSQPVVPVAPFKKKTWIPPQPLSLSLSLTPPRRIPLDYDNILLPPAQSSKSQPDFGYMLTPPGSALRLPQQQQIIHLNAELNNNEILEIKAIPQIFSTKLPAVTRYPAVVAGTTSSYYNRRPVHPSVYSDNGGSGSYYNTAPATAPPAYSDMGTSYYKQGPAPALPSAYSDMGGSSGYYATGPAAAPPAYSDMGGSDTTSYYKQGPAAPAYPEKGGSISNYTPRPAAAAALPAPPSAYSDMGVSGSSSYYNPGPAAAPSPPPAYTTHHINLKTSVLSHNVNMNVPPLTFKREGDNYPLATAVRGQIAPAPMPLIKIPHNKANVEVRLSPQNTRIAVEPPEKLRENQQPNLNTFKQRNQNYLKNTENVRSNYANATLHAAPYQKPADKSIFINNKNTNSQQQYISTIATDSAQAATNLIRVESSKQIYAKPSTTSNKVPDQKADYTSHSDYNYNNYNLTLSKVNRHIQNQQLSLSKLTTINPWLSITQQTANKTPSLGQPFIKSNQSPVNKPKSDIAKKVFVATGQRFNLRPGLKLETATTQHIEDLQLLTSIRPTNILEPPPMPKDSLLQDVVGLKPPPAIIPNIPNRSSSVVHKIKTAILPATPSIIISSLQLPLNNSFNTESPILKHALSSSRVKVLKTQPTLTKTLPKTLSMNGTSKQHKSTSIKTEAASNNIKQHSTQSTNIYSQHSTQQKINPTKTINQHSTQKKISPMNNIRQHSTNLKLNPTNIINQHSTVVKLSPTNIVRQYSSQLQLSPTFATLIIEPSVLPTNTYSINTNILDIYQEATLKNNQINQNQKQSNLLALESSEAETKKIPFSIRSNAPHFDVSSIDMHMTKQLDDVTLKTDKSISTLNKKIATQSVVLKSSNTPIIQSRIIDTKSITFKPTPTHSTTKQTNSKTITTQINLKSENPVKTTSTQSEQVHSDISNILVVMTKATGADNRNTIKLAEEEEEAEGEGEELALDYEGSLSLEIPTRDEEIVPPINANSILLGGILIATPSKTNTKSKYTKESSNKACQPACKANKNEVCSSQTGNGNGNRCECRLGFARMFPDRPCKPTYTYEIRIPTSRVGSYQLKFSTELINNSSSQYRHLSSIILDAIDRMVMQSDFRDVYHGVQLKEFYARSDNAVMGHFLLQLSENSDEKRLETVFKKYLRQSNYSIGGTELYTSKSDINLLTVKDFDECGNGNFNDCSSHAHCFNLIGSYTCSCPDGYVDISDNPIYPGRLCSDQIVGCELCNYHGNCMAPIVNGTPVCECFSWHAGATCQLNLKILLIGLIAIGTVFILLLVCMLLIYSRRKVNGARAARPIFITASNYHPSMLTTSSNKSLIRDCSMDKHAILIDTNSESSHNSEPYSFRAKPAKNKHDNVDFAGNNDERPQTLKPSNGHYNADVLAADQSDRSLTVMIPRAKYYHPTVLPHGQLNQHQMAPDKCNMSKAVKPTKQKLSKASCKEFATPSGALVSAGFEVSAIVSDREGKANVSDVEATKVYQKHPQMSRANLETILQSGDEIHRMSSWMSNIPAATALSADVRSFDETTVQAITKSMQLCFDMQTQSNTNEEANTMTERDLGSTFLLPHTHLYKPEKLESDLSGFDSI